MWPSLVYGFKDIPQKSCPSGVQTKVPIVRGEHYHTRKTSYSMSRAVTLFLIKHCITYNVPIKKEVLPNRIESHFV